MISIAIDGPSGAGKSTISRKAAEKFGFIYVDTGAIYRTIGKTQYCIGRRTVTFFRFFMIKLSKQQRPHSRSPLRLPARPHPPELPPPHVTAQP